MLYVPDLPNPGSSCHCCMIKAIGFSGREAHSSWWLQCFQAWKMITLAYVGNRGKEVGLRNLKRGQQSSGVKGQVVNIFGTLSPLPWLKFPVGLQEQLWLVCKWWAWPCSNKTLFTKAKGQACSEPWTLRVYVGKTEMGVSLNVARHGYRTLCLLCGPFTSFFGPLFLSLSVPYWLPTSLPAPFPFLILLL